MPSVFVSVIENENTRAQFRIEQPEKLAVRLAGATASGPAAAAVAGRNRMGRRGWEDQDFDVVRRQIKRKSKSFVARRGHSAIARYVVERLDARHYLRCGNKCCWPSRGEWRTGLPRARDHQRPGEGCDRESSRLRATAQSRRTRR